MGMLTSEDEGRGDGGTKGSDGAAVSGARDWKWKGGSRGVLVFTEQPFDSDSCG